MKKNLFLLGLAVMLSLTCVTTSFAADNLATDNSIANTERMQQINSRLEEIKNMDKSNLTAEQRKELRTELKEMRKETRDVRVRARGRVYLSVGAVLVIILILILIL